jgi:hypothetical protein
MADPAAGLRAPQVGDERQLDQLREKGRKRLRIASAQVVGDDHGDAPDDGLGDGGRAPVVARRPRCQQAGEVLDQAQVAAGPVGTLDRSADDEHMGGGGVGGRECEGRLDGRRYLGGPGPSPAAGLQNGDLEAGEGGLERVGEIVWRLRKFIHASLRAETGKLSPAGAQIVGQRLEEVGEAVAELVRNA